MWATFILYHNIYIWGIVLIFLFVFIKWKSESGNSILKLQTNTDWIPILIAIAYIFWMGLRPLNVSGWNDTNNYTIEYFFLARNPSMALSSISFNEEWVWSLIRYVFIITDQPPEHWFLFIEACYIGFTLVALRNIIPNQLTISFLLFISSFSFYSYSYNTIRMGMAGAVALYGFSYILKFTRGDYIRGFIVCILAIGIHRSILLPFMCILVATFANINFRKALIWWIISIFLSLVASSRIQSFFINIGFDDRMDTYLDAQNIERYGQMFHSTGFRWDFLLYSLMPILLAYIITVKKGIKNRTYQILSNTYILANSFWIMVIRAANTDRFAYLSWFMFPLIIAYPILSLHIWPDQNSKAMNIVLLYVGFTLFMNLIYYG